MKGRVPGCDIESIDITNVETRVFSCLTLVLATQPIPTGSELKQYFLEDEFWLILPEVTAIEVRLSHASRM